MHLLTGTTYPVTVQVLSGFPNHYAYLWLDANDDGYFTQSERIFSSVQISYVLTKTGTISAPATALRNRPLRLRLVLHGIQAEDYKTQWPVPDPQVPNEDFDQIRDFTVWVDGTSLATSASTVIAGWSFYPNPAAETITITGIRPGQAAEIWTMCGQQVATIPLQPAADGTQLIPVNKLAKGIYLLKIKDGAGVKKLLVN